MPSAAEKHRARWFAIGKVVGCALVIWMVSFIWCTIVLITPSLKSASPIPFLSSNRAITFPIILFLIPVAYSLTRLLLKNSRMPDTDGLLVGFAFSQVNFCLDVIILIFLPSVDSDHFGAATFGLPYIILFVIPWLTGQLLAKAIVE